MPTRRDRQFARLVCLCFALVISHQTYAQTAGLEPYRIESVITQDIQSIQGVNYEAFTLIREKLEEERAQKIKALSQDPNITNYFQKQFNVNGHYGELKSGQTVSNWTSLAASSGLRYKNQSIKGAELAGAYSVWRERTLAEAQLVANGGSAGMEALFESNFVDPVDATTSHSHSGAAAQNIATTNTGRVLDSESDWEQWAKEKGLPGAGASLMALWGIYVRRRQLEAKEKRVATNTGYDGYGGTLKHYWDKFVGNSIEGDEVKTFQSQLLSQVKAEQTKSFNVEVSQTMKAPVRPIASSDAKKYTEVTNLLNTAKTQGSRQAEEIK